MKKWIKKIFGFGVASFFGDFNHEMTNSLVPLLIIQFVGSPQAPFFIGLISSISDVMTSFLRIFSGFLSDRMATKKPLIILGYSMTALFSTLVGFSHSLGALLTYRVLSFAGSGLREPPRDALITMLIEPKYYGRAFGLKSAMDTVGSLIGPLVTFACLTIFSIPTIFLFSAIPGIFSVLAIIVLTQEAPSFHYKQQAPFSLSAFLTQFLQLSHSFLLFLGIIFIFNLGKFNILLLLTRAHEVFAMDQNHINIILVLLYAFFNFVRACSEFFIGLLSDFVNRIILLALFGCGAYVVMAIGLLSAHMTLPFALFLFMLAGISAASGTTLKKACAADMLQTEILGFGYGVLQASEGLAALIANILIGFLWTRYSAEFSFSYVVLMNLSALILLLLFAKQK